MANDITQTTINAKRMKVRLVCKHDTEANWIRAINFKPEKGELIIYDIDDNHSYERIKIGDGKTLVSNLPFEGNDKASLTASNTFSGDNMFLKQVTIGANADDHGYGTSTVIDGNKIIFYPIPASKIGRYISSDESSVNGQQVIKLFVTAKMNNDTELIYFPDKAGTLALTSDIDITAAGNNTFTGSNTFNNGGFKVNSSYGVEALSIDPLNAGGTGHTGMTTLTSAIDKYCFIELGAGVLSISSKGANTSTGHININTGTSGVDFNIGNTTNALKVLSDGITVNSKTKYCGGKIENTVNSTTYSLTLPGKSGTFALTSDVSDYVQANPAAATSVLTSIKIGNISYGIGGGVSLSGNNIWTEKNTFKSGINTTLINIGVVKSDGETISDTVTLSTYQDFSTTGYPTSKVQFKSTSEAEYNGRNQFTFLSTGGMEGGANLNLIDWDDDHAIFVGAQLRVKTNGNISLNKLKYDKGTGDYNILASLTLPEKTGTFAITDDIPIKTATLDGTTLSITLS